MGLSKTDRGNLLLGAGAIGIVGCVGAHLLLDLSVWTLTANTAIWWTVLLAASSSLWVGIGRLIC